MFKKLFLYIRTHIFYFFHAINFILLILLCFVMKQDVFLTFILAIPFYVLLFFLLITSFIYIVYRVFKKNFRDILISLTLIPLTIIYFFIIFIVLSYQPNPNTLLEKNKTKMLEVVEMVKSGEIEIVEYGTKLPTEYSYLSDSGEIIIYYSEENGYEILFFIFRGLLDEGSSIIYSETDDFLNSGFFIRDDYFEKLAPNWYFTKGG